ncbi:hypothetical protein [Anoxybacillus flavithermus]|uniref:hypothetical protein n=1 Tax=Anoxybacillus flavithermus TaxID=33934 RepID=UPI001867E0A7|nr:hypothetical protein [Anoxybacillus flavithermus]MBE2923946.1 hypothetical protein [Anoxybacillus flavithermus]MBE2926670.1 hypothetical protein [Anoxybacillus flavithermus]MBE2934995.1 hypothetical protein [Anoxybacillus flavithermus]MBE2937534.1 hypothetical protein [Anoxybacillus flavithermus]MBE2947001.1 hypothetical protein [Anoxybacillus flavithermus]
MDSFLGTLIFILPGLMLYFWLQYFGVNPVVKHNPAEFTAVSALLWFPVSLTALLTFNICVKLSSLLSSLNPIWSIAELKKASGDFTFLTVFLGSSLIISFLFGVIWAKWIHQQIFMRLINSVRKWRGVAPLSKSPSVWDEVFLNNDAQVVEIGKIDKDEAKFKFIGEIKKVSRTFEPERNILLNEIEFFTDLVNRHNIPIINIFIDSKTGMYVKIFDPEKIKEAQLKDLQDTTSSS